MKSLDSYPVFVDKILEEVVLHIAILRELALEKNVDGVRLWAVDMRFGKYGKFRGRKVFVDEGSNLRVGARFLFKVVRRKCQNLKSLRAEARTQLVEPRICRLGLASETCHVNDKGNLACQTAQIDRFAFDGRERPQAVN